MDFLSEFSLTYEYNYNGLQVVCQELFFTNCQNNYRNLDKVFQTQTFRLSHWLPYK